MKFAILILCFFVSEIQGGPPSSSRPSFSSGSRPSFSSGSRPSFSSGSKPTFSSKPASTSTTAQKSSFSSTPSTSTPTKPSFSSNTTSINNVSKGIAVSNKPTSTSFNSINSKEQTKVESRKIFEQGQKPKTEYKTPSGATAKIEKDKKTETLRSDIDHNKWVNRENRQHQFYGTYYSRPIVVYNDPYPSYFWWWMLDRSLDERALWAYHHRHDMDSARYQTMLAKDSQLEARIRQLESQNVARDVTYTPVGIDRDLMYDDNYVDAVYNPTTNSSFAVWNFFVTVFWIGIALFVLYILFFCIKVF